jgi:hypothetical protein
MKQPLNMTNRVAHAFNFFQKSDTLIINMAIVLIILDINKYVFNTDKNEN